MKKWTSKNGKWTVSYKIEEVEVDFQNFERVIFEIADNKGNNYTVTYLVRNYSYQMEAPIPDKLPKYVKEQIKTMMLCDVWNIFMGRQWERIEFLKKHVGATFYCCYGEVTMVKVDMVNRLVYFIEYGVEPFTMTIDNAFEMMKEAY